MTAAPAYARHSFGAIGADRLVALIRPGMGATQDPDPSATARFRVRVVVVALNAAAYGGETEAEVSVHALARMFRTESPGPIGLVGYGSAGALTIKLAEMLGSDVDRLALVAVPRPEAPLAGDVDDVELPEIGADVLLVAGQGDMDASGSDALWYQSRMESVRVEMIPTTGPLRLRTVWGRALEHCAPGAARS